MRGLLDRSKMHVCLEMQREQRKGREVDTSLSQGFVFGVS